MIAGPPGDEREPRVPEQKTAESRGDPGLPLNAIQNLTAEGKKKKKTVHKSYLFRRKHNKNVALKKKKFNRSICWYLLALLTNDFADMSPLKI